MTQTILFLLIGIFIIILILLIHLYDRKIVKQIDDYEKNLEQKGILKRHYIKKNSAYIGAFAAGVPSAPARSHERRPPPSARRSRCSRRGRCGRRLP